MREIIRLALVLTLICAISAAALTIARNRLGPRIEKQNDFYVRGPALSRLFGQPAQELLDQKISFTVEEDVYPIFYIQEDGRITGLAVEAAGEGGYGGPVTVMIGLDLDRKEALGLEIILHNETPGLGSQIEKSGFRNQWKGLSIAEPADLRSQGGQIDAISGATYSSKAVMTGTNRIISLISHHREEILAEIRETEKEP